METNLSSPLNGSEPEVCDSAASRALWILLVVVISIICVLGVLGNGLVIWVAGFRMAHTVTTICYLNLALADFSFTATLPFLAVSMAMKEKWPFGWLLCKLVHIVVDINLCGSVFLITLIALDRCVCVLYPVWAQNHRTVSLARKLVVGIWILALTPILPHSLFLTRVEDSRGEVLCTFSFESWSDTPEEWLKMNISRLTAVRILGFVIGFILPMSIITICYALIAAKIRRRGLVHSGRPLRVLTSVVASFFICWFPFQLVYLLSTIWLKKNLLCGSYKILDMLLNLTSALAFFNSCLNPILYVFMGQNFRERLIQSLPASLERALREDLSQTWNKGANSTPRFANTEL